MDTPKRFSCTLLHPRLFPAFITDPFNPPRMKVFAEVTTDKLSFLSSPSIEKAKVLGSEPLEKISKVTIQHLSVNARRLEILQKSLGRMALVGALIFIYTLLFRSYGPVIGILIGLAGACVSGPLFFLFNGGLTVKNNVIRFNFIPIKDGKPFYLEIEPEHELEVRQTMVDANLSLEENQGSQ